MNSGFSQQDLCRAAEIVAARTGLHFPGERLRDMERGILSAATELGFSAPGACFDWLLTDSMSKNDIEILAYYLTIGETFFYRDCRCFTALREKILPELIKRRSGEGKNIRIWSAGCCTGEEPYTIAIILREIIPDISGWNITIRATDLNRRFVKKAMEGIYTEWSFRDTPPAFRERYFHQAGGRYYELLPEIREMVDFSIVNLAEDIYPSVINNTNAMDLIFCRNVLMYFTTVQAARAIRRLYNSISDNGFLIVSPSETSRVLFTQFEPVSINGMILYRKCPPLKFITDSDNDEVQSVIYKAVQTLDEHTQEELYSIDKEPAHEETDDSKNLKIEEIVTNEEKSLTGINPVKGDDAMSEALFMFKAGNYRGTVKILLQHHIEKGTEEVPVMILLSRAYANIGELAEARRWCEKAINLEKLNAEYYHLLSVILIEQNEITLAENFLLKALYSDPDFALAHFTLGNLVKSMGREKEACRHFNNTVKILSKHDPENPVPGGDGMTAGSLAEIVRAFI